MANENGSKPCPACGKTISKNKEMCFTDIQAYGSLKEYEKIQEKQRAAEEAARLNEAVEEKKIPRPRKPRTAKVRTEAEIVLSGDDDAPKKKSVRKPRAAKTGADLTTVAVVG